MELGLFLVCFAGIILGIVLTICFQTIFKTKAVTIVHVDPNITPEERENLKKQYEDAIGGKVVIASNVRETKTLIAAR